MWILYLQQKAIKVMRFKLTTTKYQTLGMDFTVNSCLTVELFDGPGTLSPNIYMYHQESYKTSTFQSIVHLWISPTEKLEREYGFIFVTMASTISRKIKVNNFLIYNISYELAKYKVWKIFSHANLKLTIKTFIYIGYNDPVCTFAGISVYSANKNTEIANKCFSFYDYIIDKDIYSNLNETMLVLYSYKEYGHLNISLQLSTTQCKPVTINTCALTYLCQLPNNTMCKEHREQINSLNVNYTKKSTDFPISVNPGQCFILQMVSFIDSLNTLKSSIDCKIKLHHIDILKRKIRIKFQIKAFFHSSKY